MDIDRNLLFAVLALQADLLDRGQFVRACTWWAARKHLRDAQVSLAAGAVQPEEDKDPDIDLFNEFP